ncbi:MAG: hypothetical protein J3Q66DRAFT_443486 [Benniella sp.]|nr:MAG: hypothetical protein J3Q66DRAFT_443486 [Benniella sp.]
MSTNPINPPRSGRAPPSASTLLALDALLARAVSASSSSARPASSTRRPQPLPPNRQDTLPTPRVHDKSAYSRQYLADSADTEEYDHGDESTDDLDDLDLGALASTKDLSAFLQGHIQRQQLLQQQQKQQQQLLQRQRLQRQHQREQYQRLYKEQQLKLRQQRLQGEQESGDDHESEETGYTSPPRDQKVQREQGGSEPNNRQRDTTEGRVHARVMSNPFKVALTEQDDAAVTSRSRKPTKPTKSNSSTTTASEPAQIQTSVSAQPQVQAQQAHAPTSAEEPSTSSIAKEETKSTLETAVQAPSAPPKRQYKKTILRAQAALLAAQIKGENEKRDLEATRRVLARVDAIKHLRTLQSRLTYATYKVKNGLEDQPLDLVAELFEESLGESTTSDDECHRPSSRGGGTSLRTTSSATAGTKSFTLPSPVGTLSRKGTAGRASCPSSHQLATDATQDPKERVRNWHHNDTTSGLLQTPSDDSESESVAQEPSTWSTQELPSDANLTTIALKQKELALKQQRQLEELQKKQREQLQELKKIQQEQQLALQKAHAQVAARRSSTTTTTNASKAPVMSKVKGHLRQNNTTSSADKENQPPQPSVDHRSEKENCPSSPRTPSRQPQQSRTPLSAKKLKSTMDDDRKQSTDRASRSSASASQVDTVDVASEASSPQRLDSKQVESRSKPLHQQPTSPQQEEYLQRQQQKLQQNRQREQELLQRQRQLEHQQLQQHKRKQLLLQLHQQQLLEQAWETRTAREAPPAATTAVSAKQRPLSVLSSQTGSQTANKSSSKGISTVSAVVMPKKKKPLNPVHKAPSTENILATVRDFSSIRSGLVGATPALTAAKTNMLGTKRMHSVFEDKENLVSPHSSPLLRERTTAFYENSPQSRSKVHKRQKPATPASCSGESPTLQLLPQVPLATLSMQQQQLQLPQQAMDPLPVVITTDMTPTSSPLPAMHVSGGGTSADFAAALVAISPALTPMLPSDHLSSETTEFNGEFLNCFDQWMSDLGSEDVNTIPTEHDGFQSTFEFANLVSAQEDDQVQTLAIQDESGYGGQEDAEDGDEEEEEDDETELDESELDHLLYSDVGEDYYGSYGSGQEYAGTPGSEILGTQEIASDPVVADLYDWFPEPIQHHASLSPFVTADQHLSFFSADPTLSSSPGGLPADLTQELTLDFTAGGDPLWLQQELRLQQEQQLLQLQQLQDEQLQQLQKHKQQQLLEDSQQPVSSLSQPFESSEAGTEEDADGSRARTPLLDSTTSTLLSSTFSDLLSSHGNPFITTEHGFATQDASADPGHKQTMSILTI